MTSFRSKQIGLALCLMATLLFGSTSACTCSHHELAEASENDCHSHHESAEAVEAGSVNAVDVECVCFVDQPSPYTISRSVSKELRSNDAVSNSEQTIPDVEFVGVTTLRLSPSGFGNGLSYSHTLRSLLPSRAPPRL